MTRELLFNRQRITFSTQSKLAIDFLQANIEVLDAKSS